MPGNLLAADTGFPDLSGTQKTEDKLKLISNYLYTLLEQLRYTLSNLGQSNFNDEELKQLSLTLTQPVRLQIEDAQKSLTALELRADGITSRVEKAEGDITSAKSELEQTADGLRLEVQARGDLGEKVTVIEGSVDGLGITTENGASNLSDIALYFYDKVTHRVIGSLDYDPKKGNVIGRIRMDAAGEGSGQAMCRMFVGTGRGYVFNGVGYDEVDYALKLESAGDLSVESKSGNIWIMSKGKATIKAGNQYYTFGTDGTITRGDGKKVVWE